MVVQHNLTAMNSNRMLGITTGTQAKSTEKLSSGYKINRAADDAAGLSISEKMRKQIRGLSQASLNAEDGISAVQTAEGALNEVQDMLQRMNELAVKAANGTMSEDDRSYIQNEIDQLTTEIDRVAETTKFNETYLLKGDNTVAPKQTYKYSKTQYTAAETGKLFDANGAEIEKDTVLDPNGEYYATREGALDTNSTVDKANDAALLTATKVSLANDVFVRGADGAVSAITNGTAIAVGTTIYATAEDAFKNDNGEVVTVDDITNPTASTVGGAIEIEAASADITLYGEDDDGNLVTVKAGTSIAYDEIEDYSKALTYTVDDQITSDDFADYGNAKQLMDANGNEVAENGLYSYFDKEGNYKGGLFQLTTNADGENELTEITAEADVLDYVDNTATKETGVLTLNLHVGADATSNNQISIDLDAMSASSLGVKGLKVDGKDDFNALRAIETIKASIQMVSEQRSALGAVQNRLEHTIANLDNVVENTTAAESQIRDTDMASEMVKYSNNNILAQAGQAMLAQANQSNQGVLSLLG